MRNPKVYGSLPWTDQEHFRATLARVWIYSPDKIGDFPERDLLGPLFDLLGPIAALDLYGTGEDFERRQEGVLEALAHSPTHPTREGREAGEEERRAVESFAFRLKMFSLRMKEAERILEEAGWGFNPSTRKVEKTHAGNRPKLFRSKVAVALSLALHRDILVNDAATRRRIRGVMMWWFPEEDCGAERDGPIDSALRYELDRRKGLRAGPRKRKGR